MPKSVIVNKMPTYDEFLWSATRIGGHLTVGEEIALRKSYEKVVKAHKRKEERKAAQKAAREKRKSELAEQLAKTMQEEEAQEETPQEEEIHEEKPVEAKPPKRKWPQQTPRKLREKVKMRDGWKCVECGCSDCDLEVHHIIHRSSGGTDEMSNLISLCPFCHYEKHKDEPIGKLMKSRIEKKYLSA